MKIKKSKNTNTIKSIKSIVFIYENKTREVLISRDCFLKHNVHCQFEK